MASTDFLPSTESGLIAWSDNFNTKINADPVPLGLTILQSAAYTVLHDAFVAAWNALQDPNTKTQPNTVTKDDAKSALIANARELVGIIQQNPGTTDFQRAELLITIRDTEPTPVPVPANAPTVHIVSRFGKTVQIRLEDPLNPTRRGKPDGVSGATVMSFIGASPPAELSDWTFQASITRTTHDVVFPAATAAGTQVWLTAFWFNAKSQPGPLATPEETWLDSEISVAA